MTTQTLGDRQAFQSGPYTGFMSPWGAGSLVFPAYGEAMLVDPASFPNDVMLVWNWPNAPPPSGVYNFLAIGYGNYDNTTPQTPIVSQQVQHITTLEGTHAFSLLGNLADCDVLYDFFTTSTINGGGTQQHEISIYVHTPAYTAGYIESVPLKSSYTDANGLIWTAALNKALSPHCVLLMPTNGQDVTNPVDLHAMLTFLMGIGWIGGGEYFNGLGFGAEVQQGVGAMAIEAFSVAYS